MNALSGGQDWAAGVQLSPYAKQESPGEGLAGFMPSIKGQELDVCCYYGLYFSPSAICSFYPLQQVAAAIPCWSLTGWEELVLGSHSLIPSTRGVHSTMVLQDMRGPGGTTWLKPPGAPVSFSSSCCQPAHPLGRHTRPHWGPGAPGWEQLQSHIPVLDPFSDFQVK